jgi:hypothetical protein
MTSNYEFALGHAQSDLVAIIGDDDALMPGAAATVADLLRQTGAEAVASVVVSDSAANCEAALTLSLLPLRQSVLMTEPRITKIISIRERCV